jgi:SAM-dependent methyltransferase
MSSVHAPERPSGEYDGLRRHSRLWERATGRLLDEVALACGARCLDAGCGPGEVMRLLAQRVGPSGHVTGLDVDARLGAAAIAGLHASGHRQCAFVHAGLAGPDPFPEERFDLVYAHNLLVRCGDPVAGLRRLWSWTAPGGHLVVHEHELGSAFAAARVDAHLGCRLPALFEAAGIGAPDGSDVSGRLDAYDDAWPALEAFVRSVVGPAADARPVLAQLTGCHPARHVLWPLLVGVHKRKDSAPAH